MKSRRCGREQRVAWVLGLVVAFSMGVVAYAGDYGLVGWWKFNETSGTTATNATAFCGNGTLTNMSAPGCWVAGKLNNGVQFDGTNDYVSVASDADLEIREEVTVEAWVKPDTRSDYHVIACKGSFTYFLATYGGKVRFLVGHAAGGSWNIVAIGSTTLNSANWYHIVGTYKAGTATVYVNGVPDVTTSGSNENIGSNTSTLSIGSASSYSGGYYFQGVIDDVRISNRALSPNDVYKRYLNGDMAAQWHFDEGTGTTAADSGYFGNTLTKGHDTGGTDPTWVAGYSNDAMQYNVNTSVKNWCECPDSTSLNITTTGVSVAAWVKPDTSSSYHIIACKGSRAYFLATNSGKAAFLVRKVDNSGWNVTVTGSTTLNSANWYHIVGTYDVSTGVGKVYVNGVQDGTVTGTAQNVGSYTSALSVGSAHSYSGTYYFNGLIDELSVYRRALTSTEVGNLYAYGQDLNKIQCYRDTYESQYTANQTSWDNMAASGDAEQYYSFAYVLDATNCMYEATRDRIYIDRALAWAETMVARAKPPYNYADLSGYYSWQESPAYYNYSWSNYGIAYFCNEEGGATPMMGLARIILSDPALKATYGTRAQAVFDFCYDNVVNKWLNHRGQLTWCTNNATDYSKMIDGLVLRMMVLLNDANVINRDATDLSTLTTWADAYLNRFYSMPAPNQNALSWDYGLGETEDGITYTSYDTSHGNRGPLVVTGLYNHGVTFSMTQVTGLARLLTDVLQDTDANGKPEFVNFIDGTNGTYRSLAPYGNGLIYIGWVALGEFDSTVQATGDAVLSAILDGYSNPSLDYMDNGYGKSELAGHLAKNVAAK